MKTKHTIAKFIITTVILVMVLGCTDNIGSQQDSIASGQQGSGNHGNNHVPRDWEGTLLEARTDAEKYVRLVKMTLPPANTRELADSISHYNKAQESINLFLKDIQGSVLKEKKPSSSLFYTNRFKTAQESLATFKFHALEITTPGGRPTDIGIYMPNIEEVGICFLNGSMHKIRTTRKLNSLLGMKQ